MSNVLLAAILAAAAVLCRGYTGSSPGVAGGSRGGHATSGWASFQRGALAGARTRWGAFRSGSSSEPTVAFVDALAAELSAGQAPHAALIDAASGVARSPCPTAVRAARLGGDVAQALRDDASGPGSGGLRAVAACWEVAGQTGSGLSRSLGRIAAGMRDRQAAEKELSSELSAVMATARLLAVLPAFGLLMGHWVGAQPLRWLTGSPLGMGTLGLGVLLQVAGIVWLRRLIRSVREQL